MLGSRLPFHTMCHILTVVHDQYFVTNWYLRDDVVVPFHLPLTFLKKRSDTYFHEITIKESCSLKKRSGTYFHKVRSITEPCGPKHILVPTCMRLDQPQNRVIQKMFRYLFSWDYISHRAMQFKTYASTYFMWG